MKAQDMVTIFVCLFGSGGIAVWLLNRMAKVADEKSSVAKDIREIKETLDSKKNG